MKNFPLQQKYELKINIKRKVLFFTKTKTILLKYKEANILEVIEFIQSDKKIIEYFSEFILNNSNATKKDLWQILLSFEKIWEHLNNTFLIWINNNNNTNNSVILNNEEKWSNWWFNSYITLLSEKLNIDPIYILNKYTLRQLNYLTEWIIYNINEQTEKWKKENRMNSTKKQRENLSDTDAKTIKDFIYSD